MNEGQGLYVDVSDGSEFDSPAIGSQLAIRFDGETFYDDSLTGAGSRGVYVNPTAFEAGDDVAGNVAESFNLMTQAWVYPELNNGEKQTVWQAGTEQGSVNITEDGFWQFEDLGSVGVLNCPQADGLEVPYSCEEGQFPVAFNEWTHLGIYRGGNGAEVYLNGELVAGNIAPDPANFFGSFANQITIGARDDGSNGFIGLIDDFKVQGEVSLGVHDMDFNAVPPVVGDFDGNGVLDAGDINDLTAQSASGENPAKYDLNADTLVNTADVTFWIEDLFNSWSGDANLDGEFNTGDLVQILAAGTFEVDAVAVWGSGDFNGDGRCQDGRSRGRPGGWWIRARPAERGCGSARACQCSDTGVWVSPVGATSPALSPDRTKNEKSKTADPRVVRR